MEKCKKSFYLTHVSKETVFYDIRNIFVDYQISVSQLQPFQGHMLLYITFSKVSVVIMKFYMKYIERRILNSQVSRIKKCEISQAKLFFIHELFSFVACSKSILLNTVVKDSKGCAGSPSNRRLSFEKAKSHNANFKLVLEKAPTMA